MRLKVPHVFERLHMCERLHVFERLHAFERMHVIERMHVLEGMHVLDRLHVFPAVSCSYGYFKHHVKTYETKFLQEGSSSKRQLALCKRVAHMGEGIQTQVLQSDNAATDSLSDRVVTYSLTTKLDCRAERFRFDGGCDSMWTGSLTEQRQTVCLTGWWHSV